jgi:hypothetical protein
MTEEQRTELVETIKQLIRKVNQLSNDVAELKSKQPKAFDSNLGLDYTGSRTHTPLQKKVVPQQTEGTYPPVDTAPEWKVEFISQVVKGNGDEGALATEYSQQAFSEKQAIYLCRKEMYWPEMNGFIKEKKLKSYKELNVIAKKY